MSIIEDKKVEFFNQTIDGSVIKRGTMEDFAYLDHIVDFTDTDTVQEIIDDLDLAINGDFPSIVDNDITNDFQIAFITSSAVEFYDKNGTTVSGTCGLQDFKNLCVAWLNFLNTPPFNGTKV